MTLASKLTLAALLALATPTLTAARPCDTDHDRARGPVARPVASPYDREGWRDRDGHRHRDGWRERARAELRVEYARLDHDRAAFYASRASHRPGKVRKFERWYAAERAELDRRWAALDVYAWR